MTAVEALALGLGALMVLAVLAHGKYLLIVSRRIIAEVHDKPVTSTVHTDMVGQLRRIAVATEKAANDRPVQIESKRVQDINEFLVQAVVGLLDDPITHPEGLKDDIVTGRNQASEEFKTKLRTALDDALKGNQN